MTELEFVRCFAAHADKLLIERDGPIYVITPKNGAACPNWEDGGCAVYDLRPRDCRLFPFTLFVRRPEDHVVSLGYHCDTRCPLKDILLASENEAQEMVRDFANEAFHNIAIEVTRETVVERLKRHTVGFARSLLARVKNLSCHPRWRIGSS